MIIIINKAQLWSLSFSKIIINSASWPLSLSALSALSVLLWRKEAQAGAVYGADSHNRLHVKKNTESLAVVVLIMINVGNNHLWNKSQLELNNAWGISFIEKQSDKSARHSISLWAPRQQLWRKMREIIQFSWRDGWDCRELRLFSSVLLSSPLLSLAGWAMLSGRVNVRVSTLQLILMLD